MLIRVLQSDEPYPMELLLLADPEEQMVRKYIRDCVCYVAEEEERLLGIYALLPSKQGSVELVNIAVKETAQGKGIGGALLRHAIQTAKQMGFCSLDLGTGNSSIGQLAFYQKHGFRMVAIDRDYFVRHYSEPIIEHGIPCRDRVLLSLELQS